MDTTEEYIEMCKKAEEIQTVWIINKGDYISVPFETYPEPWCESLGWCGFNKPFGGIWLPRQDQLQKMVGVEHCNHLTPFLDFIAENDASRPFNIKPRDYSIEQLWLAFVMYNVYGMTWNGKDWVVE